MQDYKPNSNRFKEGQKEKALNPEKKKVHKVVASGVKTKKKSEVRKGLDTFLSEDLENIKDYVKNDVIIPTLKNTIWDAFTNTLDIILFKGAGHAGRRGNNSSRVPYVSYNKIAGGAPSGRPATEQKRAAFSLDDIIFTTKSDADEVLNQMNALLREYRIATVQDLYDMVGMTCDYTCQNYGWTNLNNARVLRSRDGYMLDLPRALPID